MIPDKIKGMMQVLLQNGYEAYIVGGAIRDYYFGVKPKDYDIFTNATGKQILEMFPEGKIIGGEERQEKILTVIVHGVEISQYRKNGDRTKTGNTLSEHQATCDFTINSIAMDVDGNIIDPYRGTKHIEIKKLMFVGIPQERVDEDILRLLRGIRFASKYKLQLDSDTEFIIVRNVYKIKELPQERVRKELMKILSCSKGMDYLIYYGYINFIFPEYKTIKDMEGGQHHKEFVHSHLLNSFEEACKITDNILLRLACFLHDIGKGQTQTFEENGEQTHFYQHENIGEEIVRKRMNNLKFSNDDIKYVTTLVRCHMYTYKDKPGKKSYIKFFNKLESANIPIEDYIMLIYSDHQSNMSKPRIKFGDFIKENWLYKKYYEIKYSEEPMKVSDLKISGQDVIEILEIKPGPQVGETLNIIFDLVMDGKLKNDRAELMNSLQEGKTSRLKFLVDGGVYNIEDANKALKDKEANKNEKK